MPTVGVSFGLPQTGAYAGQAINPLGTGGAVNPYYAGPNGISVGAVDVNPLVSFQATTGENGELIKKPLVNLHVVPNGCGLLGCDYEDDYYGTRKTGGSGGGLLDFIFPKKKRRQPAYPPPRYAERYGEPGFQPSQPVYHGPDYRPEYVQNRYDSPVYQEPVRQEPIYRRPPPQREHRPGGQVSFGEEEKVVRHEHHHFHHSAAPKRQNNGFVRSNGISFGGYDAYGRSNDGEEVEAANNVKRETAKSQDVVEGTVQVVPIGQVRGEEEPVEENLEKKSSLRFPEGRRKRRSPDDAGHHHHGEEHQAAEEVKPVNAGHLFSHPSSLSISSSDL